MAIVNQSTEPYYNGFDKNKNYVQLAFQPDRQLQQRELNELQSQLNYAIKSLGDTIMRDGDIISGMTPDRKNEKDTTVDIPISEGFIYLSGRAIYCGAQTVTIPKSGDAYVYATYNESIVTSDQDTSLLDPSIGTDSYMSKGADRIKGSVTLSSSKSDDTSAEVFHFRDGLVLVQKTTPGVSKIMDVLAQRTYETNGSYRTSGLELSVDPTQNTAGKLSVLVSDGTAYVKGYRIEKPATSRINIDMATDTRTVIDETQVYTPATGYITLYSRPVASVDSVSAPVIVTESVSRGSGMSDTLKNSNVVAIKSITSTKGTVYGTLDNPSDASHTQDFTLSGGKNINWNSGSGVIPTTGGSYQVTYYYVKTLVKGNDYKVTTDTSKKDSTGASPTLIDFRGMTGDKPAVDARIAASVASTYKFYLARRDLVTLDAAGNFTILKGIPDTIDQVTIVSEYDKQTLPVGWVTAYPNSTNASTNSYTVTNLTFSELQKLQARVRTLEYNIAVMGQDIAAAQGHDPLSLRGVFSDGFNSYERADVDIFGSYDTDGNGNVTNDTRWRENGVIVPQVGTDFSTASITLPYQSSNIVGNQKIQSTSNSPIFTNPMKWVGHIVTAPYKLINEVSQSIATNAINVNPYMVYNTQQGVLTLSPSADIWQDTEKVVVNNKEVKTMAVKRYWNHRNGSGWSKDAQFIHDNMNNIQWSNTGSDWINYKAGGKNTAAWSEAPSNAHGYLNTRGTAYGSTVTNGGENTIDSAIPYMRSIEVQFEGSGLRPFDNNLFIEFNGIKLPTFPIAPASSGAQSGTIRADQNGKVKGKFTIPELQPTGTVDVFIKNDTTTGSIANTTFTSSGTHTTIEDIINTTFYQVTFTDPLAESFQFQGDRLLAGVTLYFSKKDTSTGAAPIIVQVRPMSDGGLPSRKVIGVSTLSSDKINVSTDGKAGTTFYFDNPVELSSTESYCFVIITNSQQYEVFYSKMGEYRVDNNQQLVTNPYGGVMFTSANAQSWSVHQDQDLKFDLWTAQFEDGANSVVLFDPVDLTRPDGSLPDISVSTLMAAVTPANTGIYWEYRAVLSTEGSSSDINDGNHPWLPVGEYGEYDPQALIKVIQLRATLKASKYMSPRLSNELVNINALITGTKGTYVGRTVNMADAGYNTINVEYKQYIPTGTKVTPKFLLWHSNDSMPSTWETIDSLVKNHGVPSVTPTISDPDVGGMSQVTMRISLPSSYAGALGFNLMKVRLDLESDTQFIRPQVQSLKVILTDE